MLLVFLLHKITLEKFSLFSALPCLFHKRRSSVDFISYCCSLSGIASSKISWWNAWDMLKVIATMNSLSGCHMWLEYNLGSYRCQQGPRNRSDLTFMPGMSDNATKNALNIPGKWQWKPSFGSKCFPQVRQTHCEAEWECGCMTEHSWGEGVSLVQCLKLADTTGTIGGVWFLATEGCNRSLTRVLQKWTEQSWSFGTSRWIYLWRR